LFVEVTGPDAQLVKRRITDEKTTYRYLLQEIALETVGLQGPEKCEKPVDQVWLDVVRK
jgi:hypothetical protein